MLLLESPLSSLQLSLSSHLSHIWHHHHQHYCHHHFTTSISAFRVVTTLRHSLLHCHIYCSAISPLNTTRTSTFITTITKSIASLFLLCTSAIFILYFIVYHFNITMYFHHYYIISPFITSLSHHSTEECDWLNSLFLSSSSHVCLPTLTLSPFIQVPTIPQI